MFFVGVSLAFCLLHSLLYLFHRREPGNLYLATSALGYALFAVADTVDRGPMDAGLIRVLETVGVTGIAIMIVSFIRFGHHFTRTRSPRVFLFFVVASVVVVVVNAWTASLLLPQLLALLSLFELARVLAKGLRQPPGRHSWIVGLGFVAILVSAGVETLAGLGVLPATLSGTYKWGMLALFVALSIYLSRSVADTNRDLELRLQQVEDLTRQAVEQERREQQRELDRQLLERDHERQKAELEAARELQLSMLPASAPAAEELEVDFEMRTASEVGGDFYDFVEAADGRLTLAIGDATGHGAEAGLLVVATKGLLHAAAGDTDLVTVLARIESGLAGLGFRRRYMALLLLRWQGGVLEAISAGMPPLLVYRRDGGSIEELLSGAPPLASIAGHRYTARSIPLAAGDTVLACSDGFAERRNGRREPLGYARLEECLGRVGGEDLPVIRERIFAAADAWGEGRAREDDETVLLLRRR